MNRFRFVCRVLSLALLIAIACASSSSASAPIPDGYTTVSLLQGWYSNTQAWYMATTTNDIRFAQTQGLTLSPRLTLALASVPPIYIVTNFQQQPIFSASPTGGPINYAGLWRVNYITWLPGFSPRPITNALPASMINPNGIPLTGISQSVSDVVVDYPILILGQLGGPVYTIPQAKSVDYRAHTAVLPFFNVYCADFITKKPTVFRSLILDIEYAPVAALLKANFAPGLSVYPNPGAQLTYMFTPYPVPGWVMNPPSQYPITEQCPTSLSYLNLNTQFSPVTNVYFLDRTGASQSSIINNTNTVELLITQGKLIATPITTINGAVINPKAN